MPPTNVMIHTVDAQPSTGSPNNNALTKTKITMIAATKQKNKPNIEANTNGNAEKANKPSKEYKNNFQKDHFVSP